MTLAAILREREDAVVSAGPDATVSEVITLRAEHSIGAVTIFV